MQTNDNTKGILFIMTGMAFFSIQDSLIKFIYEDIALFELYLGRTLIQATILLGFVILTKKHITLKTHYPFLTLIRVICFFFGFSFFYISLTFMSLAMTSALFFSCPFFMSMFAKFFFKRTNWNKKMECNYSRFHWCIDCTKSYNRRFQFF